MVHPPETLSTARLFLRRPSLADSHAVYEYAADPEVTRFMTWPRHANVRESTAFLETCTAAWDTGREFCWMITVPPSDSPAGAIGCRVRQNDADFGYVLNRKAWNQGYATEAARTVVGWAMKLQGIRRVWATCDAENYASVRVLEKAGLVLEARLRLNMIRPNLSDQPRDTLVYSKIVEPHSQG